MPLFHSNAIFVGFYAGVLGGRRDRHQRALQRQQVRARRLPLRRHLLELRRRAGALRALRAREAVRRRRGEDPRRGRPRTRRTASSTPSATARRRRTSTSSCAGSASRTCSSSTARPRPPSAPSVGRAIRAAASARSPIRRVKILNERGEECPPAELGADGKILNYPTRSARSAASPPTPASSRATSTTPRPTPASSATASITRATSATCSSSDGKRFLYFDGRTDDWIRKDGENFSALQVARLLQEHPDVVLAAAYGVPCAVSDELVMAAHQAPRGRPLRSQGVLRLLREPGERRQHGSQVVSRLRAPGRRVRVHRRREKILVRNLKQVHFCRRRLPDAPLYWRTRGSSAYQPFSAKDYDGLRASFAKAEREELLDR